MKNHSNPRSVQATVMSRVHAIHFMQSPLTTLAMAAALLILSAWGIGREVWVAHVLRNMPSLSDWDGVLRFYMAAFMDTRFIVQVLSVIAAGAFIWLGVNIVRLARESLQFA